MVRASALLALALALASRQAEASPDGGTGARDLDYRLSTVETTGNVADMGDFGPDAVASIQAKLGELAKRGTDEGVAQALAAARKTNPGRFYADDFDLLGAVLAARPTPLTEDFRVTIDTLALHGSLARIGTTPAILAMIDDSGAHRAALRFDVGRRVRALGDRALPALVLTKGGSSYELRKWAGLQLETMGKRVPGDAVQTKSDDVLVEVLGAFAKVHDRDALPVVISFTSTERKRVRDAARAATLAYDKDALPKLREVYTNLTGHSPQEAATAAQVADDIFALQDRQRMADLDALVDDGLKKQTAGDTDGAIAQFDRALAREPSLLRKNEMVPTFVARGLALTDADPDGARHALEEALSLDPESPRKGQIQGALAYLDAEALRAKGIEDPRAYERVLDLDPSNDKARARLDAMRSARTDREGRAHEYAWGTAGALVVLCMLVLVGLRNRKRRAS